MNISKQLKNYRKEFNISQETLAEVIHVSRQTISNWENDKSYPDLQSLIMLSDYFKVSLDELVKGDVVKMKTELGRNEINKLGGGMIVNCILMIISLPLGIKFNIYFFIIPFVFGVLMIGFALKAEKFKKLNNIQTYKEILNYMETGEIPEEKKEKECLRSKILKGLIGALVGGLLACLALIIFL